MNERQLYIKDGRISYCDSIELNGQWISNPSIEQIHAAGWVEYTPPVPTPTPQEEPYEKDVVLALKKLLQDRTEILVDEDALEVAAAYPPYQEKIGKWVEQNERLWWNNDLWKVLQAHTVSAEWRPDEAVSLFVKISIEEWPEWVQPLGAQDAYAAGAKVSHNSKHWISNIDANVYEPGVYGWNEVS